MVNVVLWQILQQNAYFTPNSLVNVQDVLFGCIRLWDLQSFLCLQVHQLFHEVFQTGFGFNYEGRNFVVFLSQVIHTFCFVVDVIFYCFHRFSGSEKWKRNLYVTIRDTVLYKVSDCVCNFRKLFYFVKLIQCKRFIRCCLSWSCLPNNKFIAL